ncbi:hypothetical protein JY651_15055 [Pyxidicoccus parkwayensis]|uniref:Peptidase C39-like domain-containing protein n=1 Tax=Pyxidicoccus parkwayensis TaxID=2813578 RepID=A0ABX7P6Q5_9BACT|nr:papain-like cysteine protease family protein [Pyxidicoccus parkwaysis]QSQ26165.1 hypothetical protein JY651_15055 [Pyxidicoccus parkwaysis]
MHTHSVTGRPQAAQVSQPKPPPQVGWKPAVHISQLKPKGREKGYQNAAFNCGPATVAMVARGWGRWPNSSDAQVIKHLGKGLVTQNGTTPKDVAKMLERAGVPIPGGQAFGGPFDSKVLNGQLGKGRMMIAQVGVVDPKTKEVSPHYVLIRKKTADGNYVISDPLKHKSTVVTPKQLGNAVNRAPPDGGVLIPVGRPGGDLKPSTPPTVAPRGFVDPRAFMLPEGWGDFVARHPYQSYGDSRGDQGVYGGPRSEVPRGFRTYSGQMDGRTPRGYASNVFNNGDHFQPGYSMRDQFMGPRRPTGLMPALVTPEPARAESKPKPTSTPDKSAFTATDDVFTGVDTSYVKTTASPEPEGKPSKGYRLRLSYGGSGGKTDRTDKPVTPHYKDLDAYVNKLLKAKLQGTKGIQEFLQRLAHSEVERDKRVVVRMGEIELAQGGIGKKTNIESFG